MNIKSVLVFLICTIAIHIALIKVNEIVLENKEMKQKKDDKQKKNDEAEAKAAEEEEEEETKIKEIPAVSNNKIATDDVDVINDEDLRSDLLNFIKKSKNKSIVFSKDSEIELEKDDKNVQEVPGYLNFGEDIERELKTTEYNLKTASGDSDNITLINATGNDVNESAANKQFKMIQNAGWRYKNESVMNGGIDDGIGGFDPKAICNFSAV